MCRSTTSVTLARALAVVVASALFVDASIVAAGSARGARAVSAVPSQAEDAAPISRMAASLAVSAYSDDLYVPHAFNKLLERPLFSTTGEAKPTWITPKLAYGATAVAVNPETGHTWAAFRHFGRMEVNRYNEFGTVIDTWTTGYTGFPIGMSINRRGDLSILLVSAGVAGNTADVLTFVDDGALQDVKSTTFEAPAAAAVRDGEGITYVAAAAAGGGLVRRIDRDGVVTAEWATTVEPLALAIGPEDLLVAGVEVGSSRGVVDRLGIDGTNLGRWRVGGRPLSIDLGPDESVYVLVQPTPGLSLTVERRTLDGRMLLRWSVVSAMFLPWLSPGA